jgi:hypothetical protein
MGSKNLKAIAVSGTGQVDVADVDGYRQAVMDFLEEGRVNRVFYNREPTAPGHLPGRANKSGTQATRNFQEGYSKAFEWYEDPNHVRTTFAFAMRPALDALLPAASEAASRTPITREPPRARAREHGAFGFQLRLRGPGRHLPGQLPVQ